MKLETRTTVTKLVTTAAVITAAVFAASPASLSAESQYLMGVGLNDYGQIGDITTPVAYTMPSTEGVLSFVAGSDYYLFVTSDGVLYGAGTNDYGQLGGTDGVVLEPTVIATGVKKVSKSLDENMTYYITDSGDLYGLGANYYGALGEDDIDYYITTPVFIHSDVTDVGGGWNHTVFLTSSGDLYGLGDNSYGELGVDLGDDDDGDAITETGTPQLIASGVASFSAGLYCTMYVTTSGDLYGTGLNSSGQITDDTTTYPSYVPTPILIASDVSSVACYGAWWGYCTMYVTTSKDLYVYGGYAQYFLGDYSYTYSYTSASPGLVDSNVEKAYSNLATSYFHYKTTSDDIIKRGGWSSGSTTVASGIDDFSIGNYHVLYTDSSGDLVESGSYDCFGGLGATEASLSMRPVEITLNVTSVSAGLTHTLYINKSGVLYAIGDNTCGGLSVSGATGVVQAAAGYNNSFYIDSDGVLYGAGSNSYGQLGDGTTTNSSTAEEIASDVMDVACGQYTTYYVTTSGALYGMGSTSYGQLGATSFDGNSYSTTPVEIVSSGVSDVEADALFGLYITTDGDLYGLGYNGCGQLGPNAVDEDGNTLETVTTPVKIASDVQAASAGYWKTLYLTESGELYGLGAGQSGDLGTDENGDEITNTSTPHLIATDVVSFDSGFYGNTYYITTDADLYAMGSNYRGQLATGDLKAQTGAVFVASDVTAVSSGGYDMLYLTSDYTTAYWPTYEAGGKWDDTMGWIDDTYYPWVWSYTGGNWYYVYDNLDARPANNGYWIAYYTPDCSDYGWGYVYPEYGWWCIDSDANATWLYIGETFLTE